MGQTTGRQKTYKIMDSDGVAKYTAVTYGTNDGEVVKHTSTGQVSVGIVVNDEAIDSEFSAGGDQTGKDVAVQIDGIALLKLSGTVGYGDEIVVVAGGTGEALPASDNTYYHVLGHAEAAGVSGDVVPVRLSQHGFYNRV